MSFRRVSFAVALALSVSCRAIVGFQPYESAPQSDAGTCVGQPFGVPTKVTIAGFPDVERRVDVRHVTEDEKTIYFSARGQDGGNADLYRAHREGLSDAFGGTVSLDALNSEANETFPTVTRDGVIYFIRSQPDGTYELYWAQRESEVPTPLAVEPRPQGGYFAPSVSPDGKWLLFVALNEPDAIRAVTAERKPIPLPGLAVPPGASPKKVSSPVATADLQEIFHSGYDRDNADDARIWRSRMRDGGFEAPRVVSELKDELAYPDWISSDGCTLYFSVFALSGGGVTTPIATFVARRNRR